MGGFVGRYPCYRQARGSFLSSRFGPKGHCASLWHQLTNDSLRLEPKADRCHLNWIILDSTWEGKFCHVVEAHPKVRAYVKNQNLGFEVPYRMGSQARKYLPDFIVLIDDRHGDKDLLNLVVEIKGYRGEDSKAKKDTMETYWVPGVNHLGTYGRWDFAEFSEINQLEADFDAKISGEFDLLVKSASKKA